MDLLITLCGCLLVASIFEWEEFMDRMSWPLVIYLRQVVGCDRYMDIDRATVVPLYL